LVQERGISQARNALMGRAFGEHQAHFLAMLDDDEWAEQGWLKALLEVQRQTAADVVGGQVSPEFQVPPPGWLRGLDIYYQKPMLYSGSVGQVYATTNILLGRTVSTRFQGQLFDPYYSLVGGGDVEFLTRLKRLGATFAFAHLAISHETFGASRVNKRWARERAFRIGAGDMRIILRDDPSVARLVKESAKIPLASLAAGLKVLVNFNTSHLRMAGQLLFMRQVGKLSALFGRQRAVYKRTHGQ
jgi:hypothetical protein